MSAGPDFILCLLSGKIPIRGRVPQYHLGERRGFGRRFALQQTDKSLAASSRLLEPQASEFPSLSLHGAFKPEGT